MYRRHLLCFKKYTEMLPYHISKDIFILHKN